MHISPRKNLTCLTRLWLFLLLLSLYLRWSIGKRLWIITITDLSPLGKLLNNWNPPWSSLIISTESGSQVEHKPGFGTGHYIQWISIGKKKNFSNAPEDWRKRFDKLLFPIECQEMSYYLSVTFHRKLKLFKTFCSWKLTMMFSKVRCLIFKKA